MVKRLLVAAVIFGIFTYVGSAANSDGKIRIPEDLLAEYDANMAKIVEYETQMKPHVDVVQELIRRTVDRAGIKAGDYGKYAFSRTCKCLEPIGK